jgi:hypothetical protein
VVLELGSHELLERTHPAQAGAFPRVLSPHTALPAHGSTVKELHKLQNPHATTHTMEAEGWESIAEELLLKVLEDGLGWARETLHQGGLTHSTPQLRSSLHGSWLLNLSESAAYCSRLSKQQTGHALQPLPNQAPVAWAPIRLAEDGTRATTGARGPCPALGGQPALLTPLG